MKRFCGDTVRITRNQGTGVVVYVPATALNDTTCEGSSPPEPPDSAWRAFTAPASLSRLCVNTESGDVRVRRTTDPEPSPPWVDIPSVSPEDHRQIVSEFLKEISPEDRSDFQHIVTLPDFWQPWVRQIRMFALGKYSKTWPLFRFNKLCDLYLQRLKSLGIGEEPAAESLRRLKALKSASRRIPQTTTSRSLATPPANLSIRRLAIAALEAMSEDELRRVWLPLGLVTDAIGESHSQ